MNEGKVMEMESKHKSYVTIVVSFMVTSLSCMLLYKSSNPFLSLSFPTYDVVSLANTEVPTLNEILARAAMKDKTVILTTLNDAWAEPDSIFDVFLESFRIGNRTQHLLSHLVVIALDKKAYRRCIKIHPHCFIIDSRGVDFSREATFYSPNYYEMMWRRIDLLASILRLGYNFVFTDNDIIWLRDPFPRFIPDADFQIACDHSYKNSFDLNNHPNAGFNYVKSNNKTIKFYEFWYKARNDFPGLYDQEVLNKIKFDSFIANNIGMQIRFLDTKYFGGFCARTKDFKRVCTVHANCCFGLENKVNDLKLVLQDWKRFTNHAQYSWSVPNKCGAKSRHHPDQTKDMKAYKNHSKN